MRLEWLALGYSPGRPMKSVVSIRVVQADVLALSSNIHSVGGEWSFEARAGGRMGGSSQGEKLVRKSTSSNSCLDFFPRLHTILKLGF